MKHSRTGRLLAAALVAVLAGCSDSATTPTSPLIRASGGPSRAVIVSNALDSVTPHTATVASGGTQQFAAWALTEKVPMIPSLVSWTVSGVGNTIDATGLFTAGTTAGTFTVSVVDKIYGNSVTAIVTVTVASTCKPHDDKKECENEGDHGDKDHGGNRHHDRGHGGKNADEGHGGKNGDQGHGGKNGDGHDRGHGG